MKNRKLSLWVGVAWAGFVLFLLASAGSFSAAATTVTLVPAGATWRYDASGKDLGTAWRDPAFADAGWPSGPAKLGYGDGNERTLLPATPVYPCYYFRHSFEVANPARFSSVSLEVLRDDGCIVYLNGQEVARYNMPAGTIVFNTLASSALDYPWDPPISIPNLLVPGNNVIAVEVHQGNLTSSDICLDLKLTATSVVSVTLNSPAAQAGGVPIPVTLSATASSPTNGNLNVAFYGRPVPAPVPDFTLAVLPDIQNYTAELLGGTKAILLSQTDWIVKNRQALNIAYVAQLGDVTQNGDADTDESEWLNASAGFSLLESALAPDGIPYGLAVGNHDQIIPVANAVPTALYNKYFGISRFSGRAYFGGTSDGLHANNQYQFFSASGLDFIVVYLEFGAGTNTALLNWASSVLQANPTRRGIVVSHYLLETTGAWSAPGQPIYDALKANPNLFLMLCGHMAGEARRTDVYNGNTVHTLLADYQSYTSGGNGFLRLLTFSPSNNRVEVSTYSPWISQYETDANSQFALDVPMTSGQPFRLIQQNTGVSSGTATTATWTGLQPGGAYEWYVYATDGVDEGTTEVRNFTTAVNSPPTVGITNPADGALIQTGSTVTVAADARDTDGQVVSVELFDGATSLGRLLTTPYQWTFSPGDGGHTLTAVARDDFGNQTTSAAVHITLGNLTPPTAPTLLSAVAQSQTEVLLNWTDNSRNESGFEVYESLNGVAFSPVGTNAADITSATITGLAPATTYYFRVRAFNAYGGTDSLVASVTTLSPPPTPAAPSGLVATPVSTSEISLAWLDNSNLETAYEVERSPDGIAWALYATLPPNSTGMADKGLSSGTVYYYRVSARNGTIVSPPSNLAAAAPFSDAFAATETAVIATVSGSRTATFAADNVYEGLTEKLSGAKSSRTSALDYQWTFPVAQGKSHVFYLKAYHSANTDGDDFVLAWSADNATYVDMLAVSATTDSGTYQSYTLPASVQGTVYIRARDKDRTIGKTSLDSLYVDHMFIRTDSSPVLAPPPAPVLRQALAGDHKVTLSWDPSAGATSYSVWSASAGSALVEIALGVTATTYADDTAANDTGYTYAITARNSFGDSPSSNTLTATPTVPAVTEPPTSLAATAAKRRINLAWVQSVTPGTTQNIVYRSADGSTFTQVATLAPTTTWSESVPTGTTYWYRVAAVSSAGPSVPSNTASATAK